MDLFYKEYGKTGEPIFILHGLFGMLDNWHSVANRLSESNVVYTVDQRNHGHSPHSEEMNYDLMAEDLLQLMNRLNVEKATLIGHSMGGKTVMNFCTRYPDRVSKVIVVDIAPKQYTPGHIKYFEALKSLDFESFKTRNEAEIAMEQYESNYGIRLFLLKNLTRRKEGGFKLKLNLPAIEAAYYEIIGNGSIEGSFNGPVLFLKGAKSGYIQTEDEKEIYQLFPKANILSIPNAGHWVHAENYNAFCVEVESFISSN